MRISDWSSDVVSSDLTTDREHPAQRDEARHDPQGLMITDIAKQHRGERHDEKLAERPARGDDTEGAAALFGADDAPDRAEHDAEGRRRLRHADKQAETDMKPDRVGREAGDAQPARGEQRARPHAPPPPL